MDKTYRTDEVDEMWSLREIKDVIITNEAALKSAKEYMDYNKKNKPLIASIKEDMKYYKERLKDLKHDLAYQRRYLTKQLRE